MEATLRGEDCVVRIVRVTKLEKGIDHCSILILMYVHTMVG
jgi:hypothetical protein